MKNWLWVWALGVACVGGCAGVNQNQGSQPVSARISEVFNDGQKIIVNGQTDGRSQLSLVIGQLKWTADGTRPDQFTASLEPSSHVPLGKGRVGEGFIFNVGDSRFNISGSPVPAGQLVLRKNSRIVQKGNDYIVADLMQKNGVPIPVWVRLQVKA